MGNTRWLLSLSLMGSLDAQRGPMLPATPVDRALIAYGPISLGIQCVAGVCTSPLIDTLVIYRATVGDPPTANGSFTVLPWVNPPVTNVRAIDWCHANQNLYVLTQVLGAGTAGTLVYRTDLYTTQTPLTIVWPFGFGDIVDLTVFQDIALGVVLVFIDNGGHAVSYLESGATYVQLGTATGLGLGILQCDYGETLVSGANPGNYVGLLDLAGPRIHFLDAFLTPAPFANWACNSGSAVDYYSPRTFAFLRYSPPLACAGQTLSGIEVGGNRCNNSSIPGTTHLQAPTNNGLFRERYAGLTVRAPFRMDGNPAYTGSNGIYFVDNPYSYIACTLQFYWLNRSCSDQPVALNTPGSPPCGPAVDVATIR